MSGQVHPTAVVYDGARIGTGVSIGPYTVVGEHVVIGDDCVLDAHVIVTGRTTMGPGNRVFSQSVIGGPPQDLKYNGEDTVLQIGARNSFREGVTINTGTVGGAGRTVVGDDCMLMTHCHVAHDCIVDDGVVLANNVMLAGHVTVHRGAVISGGAGIHHFTTIGEYAYIGGLSRITNDVPPFLIIEGHPARIRGVNVIGLKRTGMSSESISAIKDAFKLLFRSDHPVRESCSHLEEEHRGVPEVQRLVGFMRATESGRLGRQNENPDRSFSQKSGDQNKNRDPKK